MITDYLKAIDRDLFNRYVDFNLPYLNDLKLCLVTPIPEDIFVKNILAKDEMDSFKVAPGEVSKKLHSALGKLIDQLYFYNEEEKAVVNGLLTYLDMSLSPDLSRIAASLSPLMEMHRDMIELETGDDALIVYAKFLYNRSRMMALQSRGLSGAELELTTDFDKLVNAEDIASTLARMNNIHNALKSIKQSVIPNMKDREVCAMIMDISEAMLAYRRSLIAPEKAGMGDVDMRASEAHLMKRNPTPAAGENLSAIIEKYNVMKLPFTPADFLLSLNEGVRLSGVNLMV